jgi:hypothetical protein
MTIKETGAGGFRPHDPQGDHQRQGDDMPVAESPQYKPLNPKSKRAAVLRCFLERGDLGLTCFQAVELVRDYVLRTTVSEISREHRVEFHKEPHSFTNSSGSVTTCTKYRLTLEGAARAREILTRTEGQPQRERRLAMTQDRWSRALRAQEQALSDRAARKAA